MDWEGFERYRLITSTRPEGFAEMAREVQNQDGARDQRAPPRAYCSILIFFRMHDN